jgi:cytidylate kinase
MTTDQSLLSQMRVVTISREYGSGGGEISARLAQRLGWRLIDHEIVVRVAQELQISESEAEAQDETVTGLLTRILTSMQAIQPAMSASAPDLLLTDTNAYQQALRKVVEAAAAAGQVVIVGRGAQVLLSGHRDTLHVRVVAPLDLRVAYVVRREQLDEPAARHRIQLKDRDRIRYLQETHHQHPADAHLYDLVINTGVLDLESAVDLICLALERKARKFSTPDQKLGPAAGLAPYPTSPSDIRPPELR